MKARWPTPPIAILAPLVVVPDTDLEPILHRLAEDDVAAAGCCVLVRAFVGAEPVPSGSWQDTHWVTGLEEHGR